MKFVVKLGGAALEDPKLLHACGQAIADLVKDGNQVAVVHGGGVQLTKTLTALMGKKSVFISGLRVTDAETRDAALMVLAGPRSTSRSSPHSASMARTPSASPAAMATSSARARRRPTPDLGFVGEIAQSNPKYLEAIWAMGAVPVISSIALGFDGEYYNINADEMASACAVATKADTLVFPHRRPRGQGCRRSRSCAGSPLAQIPELERAGRRLRWHAAQAQRMPTLPCWAASSASAFFPPSRPLSCPTSSQPASTMERRSWSHEHCNRNHYPGRAADL